MSASRLNPCPFCGMRPPLAHDIVFERSPLDIDDVALVRRAVVCNSCGAQGPYVMPTLDGDPCLTNAQARVAWNCRAG